MANDDLRKFLFDISESIVSIESYLGDERDFNKYMKNKLLRRAVERELEIIGEALNRCVKINPEIKITDKHKIIGLRNRVIHGYDAVDNVLVWGVIVKYIPKLKEEINQLL